MVTEEITVDVSIKEKNWTLELMQSMFGDILDIHEDFEYAIAVLLEYATEDRMDDDVLSALEEIANYYGYELTER